MRDNLIIALSMLLIIAAAIYAGNREMSGEVNWIQQRNGR